MIVSPNQYIVTYLLLTSYFFRIVTLLEVVVSRKRTQTRMWHCEKRFLLDFGVINTTDDDCEQQVSSVAIRLQQFTTPAVCPALLRVMWPKYRSFSFATLPINSLSRPNSVNIESFVRCSCHEMLTIFLQHHISKASILFLADFYYYYYDNNNRNFKRNV